MSFNRQAIQQKGVHWANRLAALLFIASLITLVFVPISTQVPTKWGFNGEPSQFISAWLALLILPGVVIVFSAAMTRWLGWTGNTESERRTLIAAGIFGAVVLSTCHIMIIWGTFARA